MKCHISLRILLLMLTMLSSAASRCGGHFVEPPCVCEQKGAILLGPQEQVVRFDARKIA